MAGQRGLHFVFFALCRCAVRTPFRRLRGNEPTKCGTTRTSSAFCPLFFHPSSRSQAAPAKFASELRAEQPAQPAVMAPTVAQACRQAPQPKKKTLRNESSVGLGGSICGILFDILYGHPRSRSKGNYLLNYSKNPKKITEIREKNNHSQVSNRFMGLPPSPKKGR